MGDGASTSCDPGEWGCIQEVAREHFDGNFEGFNTYVCGPPSMVDVCVTTLIRGRCFEKHLFAEKFYNSRKAPKPKGPVFKAL